jgi:hypothetical protein
MRGRPSQTASLDQRLVCRPGPHQLADCHLFESSRFSGKDDSSEVKSDSAMLSEAGPTTPLESQAHRSCFQVVTISRTGSDSDALSSRLAPSSLPFFCHSCRVIVLSEGYSIGIGLLRLCQAVSIESSSWKRFGNSIGKHYVPDSAPPNASRLLISLVGLSVCHYSNQFNDLNGSEIR